MRMRDGQNSSKPTGIGTSYDTSKVVQIDLNYTPKTARFISRISLIFCRFTNLSVLNKPVELYMCMTQDINGNKFILTETTSMIQHGLEDESEGGAVFKLEGIVSLTSSNYDNVYLFFKTDKGTLDIDEVIITWEDGQ